LADKLSTERKKDWTLDEVKEFRDRYREIVTIPVHVEVEDQQRVYNFRQVEEFLREAETIVVEDCVCRTTLRNCDAPVHTCFMLNERAERRLRDGPGELYAAKVSLEEAMEVLRRANEAGLVLMALTARNSDKPTALCNCCSCCCHAFSGLLRHGLASIVLSSDYVTEHDPAICIDCGVCAARCHFGARRMLDGRLRFDSSKCFGCGLCESACPPKAIKLVEKRKQLSATSSR